MHRMLRVISFLCVISLPTLAQASEMPGGFADLVEKLSPAVVNVSTTQKVKGAQGLGAIPFADLPDTPEMEPFRQFFDRFANKGKDEEHEVFSLGSGFIIDASGYVVTNNHVIDSAEEITVTLSNNSKYKAKIIGRDEKTDLALLKIEGKKPFPYLPLGDSDAMRVGDWVIAIGNPFGLGGSVTQGIISARERSINSGPFDDFLQTDAPINRGNSGGPLFNTKGEVIGINTAIFSPSGGSIGIGFSIPTALAKPVLDQLKQFGRTHRGWLGVKIQEVSDEVAESVGLSKAMGALVLDVSANGPASKAGIQAGDIITEYNGKEIKEMRFLPRLVAESKIGSTVTVTYWRKNASKTAKITIGELDETKEASDSNAAAKSKKGKAPQTETVLGMSLVPLNSELRDELSIDSKQNGLAVVDVASGSEAAHRGIRGGDVLVDVNGEEVDSVTSLRKAFVAAKKSGRNFALVKVVRGKDTAFITLPTVEEGKK